MALLLCFAGRSMIRGTQKSFPVGLPGRGIAVTAGALLLFSLSAIAQETRPTPSPPARDAAPARQPGMLDSVERWFKDSFNRLNSNVDGARDTLGGWGGRASGAAKEAADAAQEAADAAREAVAKFPNAKMVDGRARCAVAANGAPDCRGAAETVCKAKGFASGSSLDIQSSQKCSARAWLSRSREPGDCEMQSFVTRAMCQ